MSSNEANKLVDNLGYITHCFNCGDRREHPFMFQLPLTCIICGGNSRNDNNKNDKKLTIAGPLWIKPIFNKRLISDVLGINGNNYGARSYDLSRGDFMPPSKDNNSDRSFIGSYSKDRYFTTTITMFREISPIIISKILSSYVSTVPFS